MFNHPQLLQLLSQAVSNDPQLMLAARRFMPIPPVEGMPQAMGASGQVQQPFGPQGDIGQVLSAAANKDLQKPLRSRSDWQTIGSLLNTEN